MRPIRILHLDSYHVTEAAHVCRAGYSARFGFSKAGTGQGSSRRSTGLRHVSASQHRTKCLLLLALDPGPEWHAEIHTVMARSHYTH